MFITCWYRVTEDGLKYNHYSHGYDPDAMTPPYMFESQRIAWQKASWAPKKAMLEGGKVLEWRLYTWQTHRFGCQASLCSAVAQSGGAMIGRLSGWRQ